MWPYNPKTLLIQTIGYQPVGAKVYTKHFRGDNLRILKERFGEDSFISQTEAEFLAEKFNVQPERVLLWFCRQRQKGNIQTVERVTKVITLIK